MQGKDASASRNFNDLLIDSIDETVIEILGGKVTPAFWRHLQAQLGISREEMPNELSRLFSSLQTIFGTGEETVGEIVIRKLYKKANLPLDFSRSHSLVEYAVELQQILCKDNGLRSSR